MGDDVTTIIAELGFSALGLGLLFFLALLFSAYVKIVTVLGMVRAGFGIGSLPGAFVTSGLALALTFFVMFPSLRDSAAAVDGSLRGKLNASDRDRAQAVSAGISEWKKFIELHARKSEVERFQAIAVKLDKKPPPTAGVDAAQKAKEVSWRVLAPAFIVSELREAFQTGLSIFLPFLVIDLLVAIGMAAVGIDRLNPVFVAFPLKLLMFVLLDGWSVITTNLVSTYV